MDLKDFIEKFAEALEIDDTSKLTYETKFRELPEWGSLAVLSVIAMLDEEYGVEISPKDIKNSNNLKELFDIINSKK